MLAAHALRTPLSALTLQLEGLSKALTNSPSVETKALACRVEKALLQCWRLAAAVDMLLDAPE
jgi:hypothetical protein